MRRRLISTTIIALLFAGLHVEEVHAMPNPTARYAIIGASVTLESKTAIYDELGPNILWGVDYSQSFIHAGRNGRTLWDWYLTLAPQLRGGDWLIIEAAHGGVPVEINRAILTRIVADLPDNIGLAVVQPSTAYEPGPTVATDLWNAEMYAMIPEVIEPQPYHAAINWYELVAYWTRDWLTRGKTTMAQATLGAPLLRDGRHVTAVTGAGRYARAFGEAVGLR